MTRIRTIAAITLGLAFPAGLILALYLTDWRHALAGLTGLIVGTASAPKRRAVPWPAREDLPESGRT